MRVGTGKTRDRRVTAREVRREKERERASEWETYISIDGRGEDHGGVYIYREGESRVDALLSASIQCQDSRGC